MDYATIRKFCDFADCSADYLLGRVDSPELVLKKAPLGGDVFQEYAINKDAPDLTDEDILTLKEIIKQHQSEQQK